MRPQSLEERGRSTVVDRRGRLRDAVFRVLRSSFAFKHERHAHEQRIAVRALVLERLEQGLMPPDASQ